MEILIDRHYSIAAAKDIGNVLSQRVVDLLLALNSIEEVNFANILKTLSFVIVPHVEEIEVDQIVIQISAITRSILILSLHSIGFAVVDEVGVLIEAERLDLLRLRSTLIGRGLEKRLPLFGFVP